jgi:ketosteroid isomerase-like protein
MPDLLDTARAMSQENVEIVGVVVDAVNRADWEGALQQLHPDFELDFSRAVGPVSGVFKLDQIRTFLDEFFGLWEAVRAEVDQLTEAGDQVATAFTSYFRGRDAIEVTGRPSFLWTIRDGRIVHARFYQEWQEALAAARVSRP